MSTSESSAVGSNVRVCPDCGTPAPTGSFCEECGLNLAKLERLPSRDEWERAREIASDQDAQAIARRLATIEPAMPGLFDVAPDGRRLDNPAVVGIVQQAVIKLAGNALRSTDRAAVIAIDAHSTALDATTLRATATATLTAGRRIDQDFDCQLGPGKSRAILTRSGAPRLFTGGREIGCVHTESLPSLRASASNGNGEFGAIPGAAPYPSGLSDADAQELAARRAYDAVVQAKLHGWKLLTIWYAFWCVTFGIASLVGLVHGQVGVFFVGLLVSAASGRYTHYLYNGGRYRVWFFIW